MGSIHGIIAPIVTPMFEDESINEGELRRQVDRMITAGIHGIFAFGTNGEGYILSAEEKEFVLSVAIDQTKGRVPVYAGTGCIGTMDTIALSRRAEALGADYLSIITPSFAAASQDELFEHYAAIAGAVNTPIVLYNIPARTGNALAASTVRRLSEVEGIVGIKDSSGNFDNMLQYIEAVGGEDFAVLSGNDSLILWNLLAGGAGGIAGCANVFPENMVAIYESFASGDIEAAKRSQENIRSFRDCFQYGNPNTIVKVAVALLGHPVGPCRKPFGRISPQGLEAVRNALVESATAGIR
jgi:4-hydroxy-tetrahydrodipicolinate synthase